VPNGVVSILKEFAENNHMTIVVSSRSKQTAEKAVEQSKGKAFAADIDIIDRFSVNKYLQQYCLTMNELLLC
jgi:saccharopine dehydrogenase-like NADP-dependent oxidoreductase